MAAFETLDYLRIDVCAIVTHGGLATIEERRHGACRDWLIRNGYEVKTFDCRPGLSVAVPKLGRLLQWEQQFGYSLGPESRNLDALHDGFEFAIPAGGGVVFEVLRADIAWQEDARWLGGLLTIVQEQCRSQLARGRRFFALLVVPDNSRLIGVPFDQIQVPAIHWNPYKPAHEFLQ